MNEKGCWVSPDGRIKKDIVVKGNWGSKPWENSECKINISNCSLDVSEYNNSNVVIGENDSCFGRLLDICLQTMLEGEISDVTFKLRDEAVSFRLHLVRFNSDGDIWEWDADKKYKLALKHKNKGVELFHHARNTDASHRFSKAFKIVSSIPIDVEEVPEEIDDVKVSDIKSLKANLYNNLASCYLKINDLERVIYLCKKVLEIENENKKALYKISLAYIEDRDYERAESSLKKLLAVDPKNKLATEKLKFVNVKLAEANAKVENMIKKMFQNV